MTREFLRLLHSCLAVNFRAPNLFKKAALVEIFGKAVVDHFRCFFSYIGSLFAGDFNDTSDAVFRHQ